jgi:hypothetical protein
MYIYMEKTKKCPMVRRGLGRELTWEADQLQKKVDASKAAVASENAPSALRESANEELLRVLRQELSEARSRLAVRTSVPLFLLPVSGLASLLLCLGSCNPCRCR